MMDYVAKDVPLWSVTTWDKKFNGVDRSWQPKTIKYKYLLSAELDKLDVGGDVYLLYTGQDEGYTCENLAGDAVCDGEIVSIPWGGTPTVKYYKGKFVTGDNRIATSNNPDELLNKYLYYFMKGRIKEISSYYRGAGLKHPSMKSVLSMRISYPTIEKQKDIIVQFEAIENLLSLFQVKLDFFDELIKSRFVEMFGDPVHGEASYPVLRWNDVFETKTGKLDSNQAVKDGQYPFFTCSKEPLRIDTYAFDCEALLLAGNNAAGKYDVKHYKGKFNAYQRTYVLRLLNPEWCYELFKLQLENQLELMRSRSLGTNTRYLTLKILGELEFIVPPLALQQEFAAFVQQVDKSKFETRHAIDKLQLLYDSLAQEYFGS